MSDRGKDAEIVAGFLRDETPAVTVVDQWIRRAAGPFRRRLANQWDDVLQDLRLEVVGLFQGGRFRGESSLKTYLWRVVGHSCLDRIRADRRWRWTDLEDAVTEPAASSDAERRSPWNPTRDLLMRVLERIPQDCRRLWKWIVEGFSYREMSQRVGVSEGALRVRALRCRKHASSIRADLLAGGNEIPALDASSAGGASSMIE